MVEVVLVHSNFRGSLASFVNLDPPPGLGYLGAILEKNGIKVRIIDPIPEGMSKNDVENEVVRLKAKVVGLTCLTSYRHDTFELAGRIKSRLPEARILVGGAHVSFLDEVTLERVEPIDAIVRGEGEFTCLEYVNAVLTGRGFEDIAGLTYRGQAGEILRNPDRPLIQDLDSLPFPAYHLFKKFGKYPSMIEVPAQFKDLVHGPILSSRGCPFKCTFCSSSIFWHRKFRPRSPGNVVDELEYEHDKFGVQYIRFYDDNFTVNKDRVIKICDEILRRGIRITWRCESRIDGTDKEMLQKMAEAGCHEIEYGIETGSKEVMKNIGKNINLEKVPDVIRMCKEHKIQAKAFFIVGLQGETMEDFRKTMEISKLFDYCGLAPLLIFPGSPLYEGMKSRGKISDNIWFDTNLGGRNEIMDDVPMFTEAFSEDEMIKLRAIFYEKHPSYRERKGFLSKVLDKRNLQYIFKPHALAARFRSVLRSYGDYNRIRKELGL